MLVLTRKIGEDIFIDCPDGVRITIRLTDIERSKAHIAIAAPRDYVINRAELLERKETQS